MEKFSQKIKDHKRKKVDILQINIGKVCNQACTHCHVESSPTRTENMEEFTVDRILKVLENSPSIHTVDITGGAPEMNPYFKKLVSQARALDKKVIDRCNLTILFEKGYEDIPQFLFDNQVQVVASLPCYSKENVENQRGRGVFNKSIEGLKILNNLGYGIKESHRLDLVYNPSGPFLPPDQKKLEESYKRELKELFNLSFNNLYTITNMPIKRFLYDLEKSKKLDEYMKLLYENFNQKASEDIMCRNLVSISFDGDIFDCDFNQMLELPIKRKNIWDIESFNELNEKRITFENHCYACTAGAGSSCSGSLT